MSMDHLPINQNQIWIKVNTAQLWGEQAHAQLDTRYDTLCGGPNFLVARADWEKVKCVYV